MDTGTHVAVVQQTYEAVGRGDIPAVLALLSEDVEWTLQGPPTISFAGTRLGHEGVIEFFTLVGTDLEFELFEPYAFIAQDDRVVVLGRERSHHRLTGASVVMEWAHVYTFRDGKITKFQGFEDTAALATASAGH